MTRVIKQIFKLIVHQLLLATFFHSLFTNITTFLKELNYAVSPCQETGTDTRVELKHTYPQSK